MQRVEKCSSRPVSGDKRSFIMGANNEETTNNTKSDNPRCGGPDDSREAGAQGTGTAKEDNTQRAGGPDDSRAASAQGTATAKEDNTPRAGGPDDSRATGS